jgi:hypothetical protein
LPTPFVALRATFATFATFETVLFGLDLEDEDLFWTCGMAAFYLLPPITERGKWACGSAT